MIQLYTCVQQTHALLKSEWVYSLTVEVQEILQP